MQVVFALHENISYGGVLTMSSGPSLHDALDEPHLQ